MSTGWFSVEGKENLTPDICVWNSTTLALSARAHRLLGELMRPFGEFLPIHVEGEVYQIFNCLTVADALNSPGESEEPSFDEGSTEEKLLFKCPNWDSLDLFCNERFINAVEDFGLAGLAFDIRLGSPFTEN